MSFWIARELERQEAALVEQEDQGRQAQVLADRAVAAARSFDRLVEVGTLDEKRTLVRAFLRGIDFDPDSQAGKAHFWVVPAGVGGPCQPNPGGRGRRSDLAEGGLTKGDGAGDGAGSLFPFVSGDTRYAKKRSAAQGGASSFHMVAGACYAAIHNALGAWLIRRWALPRQGRRGDPGSG